MTRFTMTIGLALLAIGPIVHAQEADLERLDVARSLWQAAQDGNYRFRYQKFCECDRTEPKVTVVSVAEGLIEDVHHLFRETGTQVPARAGSLSEYWTMEDLFDKLIAAYQRDATVRVNFDDERGFPSSIYIDYRADLVGEETDLRGIALELP